MSSLPYLSSPGNISKALDAIKAASVPENGVSQDFVKTILKIPGGSGDQMTSFLKKIGFADQSGSPTERYIKFRNPSSSGKMIADAVQEAYSALYVRNEYAHKLPEDQLVGLIVEETGNAHDSRPVKLIAKTMQSLLEYADFEAELEISSPTSSDRTSPDRANNPQPITNIPSDRLQSVGLNLGYTINLNLPPTTDVAVFDAIFSSLKRNLMSSDDA